MQAGILDVLLNQIIDHTVHQFAVRAVESIDRCSTCPPSRGRRFIDLCALRIVRACMHVPHAGSEGMPMLASVLHRFPCAA